MTKQGLKQENSESTVRERNFGYLRSAPDLRGQDWMDKVNLYGNYLDAEMIQSFIVSPEYCSRFGPP